VLRQATEHLVDQVQTQQVTISLIRCLAWAGLFPLCRRSCANPHTEINVVANHRNYLSDASDMSIRFGNGHWVGYQAKS
jgi:hypothetical protein